MPRDDAVAQNVNHGVKHDARILRGHAQSSCDVVGDLGAGQLSFSGGLRRGSHAVIVTRLLRDVKREREVSVLLRLTDAVKRGQAIPEDDGDIERILDGLELFALFS